MQRRNFCKCSIALDRILVVENWKIKYARKITVLATRTHCRMNNKELAEFFQSYSLNFYFRGWRKLKLFRVLYSSQQDCISKH